MKALTVSVVILVLVVALKSAGNESHSFYVPEARQPAGFPQPGNVDEIVVKSYPKYRSAKVTAAGEERGRMFGRLFQHIKSNHISMTVPVEMTFDKSGPSSMAFIYEQPELGEVGTSDEVEVADRAELQVVSIAVRGEYTKDRFDACCQRLRTWLADNGRWQAAGQPRYLAFNSPFVPKALRYGEVQIPIERKR